MEIHLKSQATLSTIPNLNCLKCVASNLFDTNIRQFDAKKI